MVRVLPSDEALLAGMAAGYRARWWCSWSGSRRLPARAGPAGRRRLGSGRGGRPGRLHAGLDACDHLRPAPGRAAAWLLRITRNLAIDASRVRRDQPFDPDALVDLLTGTDEPRYDGADELRRALRALPSEQARPVVLAVYIGLTAQEIATQEKIPLGTVKTRIRRGLARLRRREHTVDERVYDTVDRSGSPSCICSTTLSCSSPW